MSEAVGKPKIEEILEYGAKTVEYWIRKCASSLPEEQADEIRQEAALKLFRAYDRMDPAMGIKAFCQQQVRGAVLDYIRDGSGFEESVLKASEDDDANKLTRRLEMSDDNGDALDVGDIAGIFGRYFEDETPTIKADWELLSRLAGEDEKLHLVCKILLGFRQEEVVAQYPYGITRERLSQQFYEFFDKLDDPMHMYNPVVNQQIFALGLCTYYGMPEVDCGYGWDLVPYDLLHPDSFKHVRDRKNPLIDKTMFNEMLRRSDLYGKYVVKPKALHEQTDDERQIPLPLD